jgi:hypothetical protein
MISLFRKPKRLFEVSDAIFYCVKMMLVYRAKKDKAFRAELMTNGGHPEFFEEALNALSQDQLASTKEYYIIYLIVIFIRMQRKAGKQFSYKDIVYTIDQRLPKRRGHIPVEMWAPKNYSEYIMYRLTVDFEDRMYPAFIIDNLYDEIYSYLNEHFHSAMSG